MAQETPDCIFGRAKEETAGQAEEPSDGICGGTQEELADLAQETPDCIFGRAKEETAGQAEESLEYISAAGVGRME